MIRPGLARSVFLVRQAVATGRFSADYSNWPMLVVETSANPSSREL